MKLSNTVVVPGSADELFDLLLNVERVASCMPGSSITGNDGESYDGEVRVKLGPLSLMYQGTVKFLEVDASAGRAVLSATGREQHGQGDVEAKVVATVSPDPEGARLSMETDMVIRGRIAQFGRGVINDVSQQLMQEFAENVGRLLEVDPFGGSPESPVGTAETNPSAPRAGEPTPAEASVASTLDGYRLVVLPILRRVAPSVIALAIGFTIGAIVRGRGSRR